MNGKFAKPGENLLPRDCENIGDNKRKNVLESIENRSTIARNINREIDDDRSLGERAADAIARFGGSWTFMFIFAGILIFWVILNSYILAYRNESFDPYPYILLNLFLSMLAAIQAPIIMMSQNRQAARDRLDAGHAYEVNLKAELEIRTLHEKLDEIRDKRWGEMVNMQQQQIRLLEKLLREHLKSYTNQKY
jgi:uncharacterized membrane protein